MRKVKLFIITAVLFFSLLTSVFAATYSLKRTGTVSTSLGTSTVTCTGYYYSSGNTRWSRTWTATNPVMSTYVSSNMTTHDDIYMTTVGTVSMTGYDYSFATNTKTFKFKFNGTKVVADN